jgi:hypothetical protein
VRRYFIRTEESRQDSETFNEFLAELSDSKKAVINETMFADTLADSPYFCMLRMTAQKSAQIELSRMKRRGISNPVYINALTTRPRRNFRKISGRILTSI